MFSFLRRQSVPRGRLGAYATKAGVCLVHLTPQQADERPNLVSFHSGETDEATLRRVMRDWGVQGQTCTLALGADQYQLLQAEAPPVPDDELRDAMRWRASELVGRPVQDAVVDVFPVPSGNRAGRANTVFTVVAGRRAIDEQVAALRGAGLQLNTVDITELAVRNVLAQQAQDAGGVAVVLLTASVSLIMILRNGHLYLTRRLAATIGDLRQAAGQARDPHGGALEAQLSTELRRSLDYYESSYGEQPVSQVLLWPVVRGGKEFCQRLTQQLGLPVELLRLEAAVDSVDTIDVHSHPDILMAVGAALRTEAV